MTGRHVPGGSGNGLAASILRACSEEYGTVEAAFVIARGATQPIDISSVHGEGASAQVPTPFYSFLSLSWGIVADIDIESETFRSCCGTGRFEVSTIQRSLCLRRYHGRLSYLPASAVATTTASTTSTTTSTSEAVAVPTTRWLPASLTEEVPQDWTVEENDFIFLWACNTACASFEGAQTPEARLSDGCWQLFTITGEQPHLKFTDVLKYAEDPAKHANQHPVR